MVEAVVEAEVVEVVVGAEVVEAVRAVLVVRAELVVVMTVVAVAAVVPVETDAPKASASWLLADDPQPAARAAQNREYPRRRAGLTMDQIVLPKLRRLASKHQGWNLT